MHTGQVPDSFDSFNISYQPTAYFPSFSAAPGMMLSSSLGHIEWAGEFAWHQNNWGVGLQGQGNEQLSGVYSGGQIGGPVVIHDLPLNVRVRECCITTYV
jgi:hypothetical protein